METKDDDEALFSALVSASLDIATPLVEAKRCWWVSRRKKSRSGLG
jgi:hypothetical protein